MTVVVTLSCLLAAGFAAVWFSPYRRPLLRLYTSFDKFRFTGRIEQINSSGQSDADDAFFQVSITGRIPVPEVNCATQIRIQILDITENAAHPLEVYSVSDEFCLKDDPAFDLIVDHGIVPSPKSALADWAHVAAIPCELLRFAYRGRRKLKFQITMLSKKSQKEIISDEQTIEYVSCSDGYQEIQQRRSDVITASVNLVCSVIEPDQRTDRVNEFLTKWIKRNTNVELSTDHVQSLVDQALRKAPDNPYRDECDVLMAYGNQNDRLAVMKLAFETSIFIGRITRSSFGKLGRISSLLDIPNERFLESAQKSLLNSECTMESPQDLLGVSEHMSEEAFVKCLNNEYRKWNARVTHPDSRIRHQADRILTLIADLRSQRLQACSA